MSNKRCGKGYNEQLQETINEQNDYCGVTKWHEAGITGKGIVIWDRERHTEHGCTSRNRILDAAPNSNVYNAGMESETNGKELLKFKAMYQPECSGSKGYIEEYKVEDFIKKFNIKIVSVSFAGSLAEYGKSNPRDKKWIELQKKYNLIFVDAMDNDGDVDIDVTDSACIHAMACSLVNGKPKRAHYSTTGTGNAFIDFVGVHSGTSFSCPYLAGKIALILERYGNHLTQNDILAYLKDHAVDLDKEGYDRFTGYGLVILDDYNEVYTFPDSGTIDPNNKFKDVDSDSWYSKFVNYASDKGYMSGYTDGTFKPSNEITRAEMAAILYNLKNK